MRRGEAAITYNETQEKERERQETMHRDVYKRRTSSFSLPILLMTDLADLWLLQLRVL